MGRRSWLGVATLVAACAAPPGGPGSEAARPEVVVYSAGAASKLGGSESDVVVRQLRHLLSRCSLDSNRYPKIFAREGAAAWSSATSAPRLWARLAQIEDFTWPQGRAPFRELLLELPPGSYPGKLLGRGPAGVVQFTKCDGLAVIELVCLEELSPFVPRTYGHSCDLAGPS